MHLWEYNSRESYICLVCVFQSVMMVKEILKTDEAAVWIISNEKFRQVLEFHLWDFLRLAASNHVHGVTPCTAPELDDLLVLMKNALSDLYYEDVNLVFRIKKEDASIYAYDDNEEDKAFHDRDHLIYFEIRSIIGVTTATLSPDLKKWNGKASNLSEKSKKKLRFSGMDQGITNHASTVIKNGMFMGKEKLPSDRPDAGIKLYPMNKTNRTIMG